MARQKSDYDVGYAKPPTHSRFQPGQSGNPKGRAKGTLNLKTDLTQELGERIRVKEGARELSISKQRALLKALVAKALKGDTRAAALLIALVDKHIAPDLATIDSRPLSRTEDQILTDFLRQHGALPPDEPANNMPDEVQALEQEATHE
jgi:hypothetical protein